MTNLVIAMDGPSGSGKSSTSKGVAEKLGLDYLDTGSMYRAFTLYGLENNVEADDEKQVQEAIEKIVLELITDPKDFRVRLNGKDVTAKLHSPIFRGQFQNMPASSPFATF